MTDFIEEKYNQGSDATRIFSGESGKRALQEVYGESAELFARAIRKRIEKEKNYTLADLGAFKGELAEKILDELQEYDISVIAVDVNPDALTENKIASKKIIANLTDIPLRDGEVDMAIMRYALQWNTPEKQEQIIKEVQRIVSKFAIIQHAGSDNKDADEWRSTVQRIFNDDRLPELKRGEMFFSAPDELEELMKKNGIRFEKIDEKQIDDLVDVYCERYQLDSEKCSYAKQLMGEKNRMMRTTWVVYPR